MQRLVAALPWLAPVVPMVHLLAHVVLPWLGLPCP